MDLKIGFLVFITRPLKIQGPTNIATLEMGFGTKFKCGVCGLTGLRHMTFSDEQDKYLSLSNLLVNSTGTEF